MRGFIEAVKELFETIITIGLSRMVAKAFREAFRILEI